MVADGLFEQFPCDEVYGMHNWPTGPHGQVAVRAGPAMAGADFFDIRDRRARAPTARIPNSRVDPIVVAMTLGQAMQTIVSRNIDPTKTGVVSITKINAGSAYNVIPETAHLAGTVRCFDDGVRQLIRERIHELCAGIGAALRRDDHRRHPRRVLGAQQRAGADARDAPTSRAICSARRT